MRDRTCMFCGGRPVGPDPKTPVAHKMGCANLEKWYRKGIKDTLDALSEVVRDSPSVSARAASEMMRGIEAQVRIRLPIEDERPHRGDG